MGALDLILDSIAGASTLSLRIVSIYFTQFLPLGPRFLPIIYNSFLCYAVAVILKYFTSQKLPRQTSRPIILLLGLYEPKHTIAFLWALFVNCLALFACVDFVYRPHIQNLGSDLSFSRVGYTTPDSTRIVLRAPNFTAVELSYRALQDLEIEKAPPQGQDRSTATFTSIVQETLPQNDFVTTFHLQWLQPNTTYTYHTNTSLSGTFTTPPHHLKQISFISTSCLKPGYPYRPLNSPLSIPGLTHLATYLQSSFVIPQFTLFLGDFIYIDLPLRLGSTNAHYREAYRQVYASPSWTEELRSLPWLHVYDDHEFENDWAAGTTGLFDYAVEPFISYQADGNPPPVKPGKSWYIFSQSDIEFFVADTRVYRSDNSIPDGEEKTMLGPEQLSDLEEWLGKENGKWKVFVTSVPFTRNWRGEESVDSWAGYLFERRRILELMWKVENVIIISGDRHEHATTTFPSPFSNSTIIEFSTSPLSQFFQPFERTYKQIEQTDILLHYHPRGNSKFGIFTFDTRSEERRMWTMTFELVVDGVKRWEKVTRYGGGLGLR